MQTQIQYLTLRQYSATDNVVAQRLWVERLLNAADMRPPGMSSGTVLIIREIRGLPPLSGAIMPSAVWRYALLERLTQLYHQAERPALKPAIELAKSIVFEDSADMLMLFTKHVVTHEIQRHWYWHKVIPNLERMTSVEALVTIWLRLVKWLPVALNRLPPQIVMKSLQELADDQIVQVINYLSEEYHLDIRIHHEIIATQLDDSAHDSDETDPIWQQWLPHDIDNHLHRKASYLYGLCLTLARLPVVAHTVQFQEQTKQWLDSTEPPPRLITRPTIFDSLDTISDETARDEIQGIFTSLAGVFFLINLLKLSGFPDNINHELLSEYSGWAIIEWIARTLLEESIEYDPIWEILASLDNRQLDETVQISESLDLFVYEIVEYLKDAFEPLDTQAISEVLLFKTGHVQITKTHIDVYMSLAESDIRLRRQGLDFDPGWIPDFGYIINFHFE